MALGVRSGGRQKGTPNKTTAIVKDCILQAAELAGNDLSSDQSGLVGYLRKQAIANPVAFMSLLGRILPTQIEGGENAVQHIFTTIYEQKPGS
jgi:hypothetical protein